MPSLSSCGFVGRVRGGMERRGRFGSDPNRTKWIFDQRSFKGPNLSIRDIFCLQPEAPSVLHRAPQETAPTAWLQSKLMDTSCSQDRFSGSGSTQCNEIISCFGRCCCRTFQKYSEKTGDENRKWRFINLIIYSQ